MTTVLFIHGLETGPRGAKAIALEQAGFTVIAEQMPCGRRGAVRDPVVWLTFGALAVAVLFASVRFGAMGFVLGAVSFFVTLGFVRSRLIRRMVRRSLEVQTRLLAKEKIDVVVGSSFGGAIGLELLARGAWKGPTVLLCPAHRLIAERTWTTASSLPADASKVLVVHARQDETVPIDHSRWLVRNTAAKLIEVDDDHRLTASATPENLKAWIVSLSPTGGEGRGEG
jgi:pimeloyl-ACP methyl ester carboxylesterase